jgi:glutamate synthase (NADPH/NADH) small chain
MEDEHLALLRRRYHLGAEEPAEPAPEQLAVYAGVDPDVGSTEALLELALTLERRARDFFAGHVREHADGSPAWKLYRELEAEEYEHVAILETELERLRAGRPGQLVAP